MEYTAKAILERVARFEKKFKKSLGQNFLFDRSTLEHIVGAVGNGGDNVVEIGAGVGILTELLCQNNAKVVTVEIDETLFPILREAVTAPNFHLYHGDILQTDLAALNAEFFDGQRCKIVGNLPYYITTDIVKKLVGALPLFDRAVIMVQKEFADRMTARPGQKEYRAMTAVVQALFDIERVCVVPPHCFVPAPHVDSAVITLTPKSVPLLPPTEGAAFLAFVNAAFAARRKQLASLGAGLGTTREVLTDWLMQNGLPVTARAEILTPPQFADLYLTVRNSK